jgi:ATP-dependent Lon protease
MVLRAGKLNALKLMRSTLLPERILALQRLVFEDPTLERLPQPGKYREVIAEIEDGLADLVAQRTVEDKIDSKVNVKMAERHQEYLKDLKLEAIREDGGPRRRPRSGSSKNSPRSTRRKLAASALQLLRPPRSATSSAKSPRSRSLLAKISSPFPQHVILYGPPGVGKTTVARLALEVAKTRGYTPFAADAPFVEASGATLRWDPRETTNPLLGSVHDPIYQGSRREFAEGGIPEPKLGLVTKAHGGVLFIDELGEMDPLLQPSCSRCSRTSASGSSRRTTMQRSERSGVRQEAFRGRRAGRFRADRGDDARPERNRRGDSFALRRGVLRAADRDRRFGEIVVGRRQAPGREAGARRAETIASYTIEGRKAVQILADAHGHALYRRTPASRKPASVTIVADSDVTTVVQPGRLVPHTPVRAQARQSDRQDARTRRRASRRQPDRDRSARVSGGGAPQGHRSLQRDRRHDGQGQRLQRELRSAQGGGRRSARLRPARQRRRRRQHRRPVGRPRDLPRAVFGDLAPPPLPQDVAMTGELSIAGLVRPVGGIVEKLYAARQAGMRIVLVPRENARDVDRAVDDIESCRLEGRRRARRARHRAPGAPLAPPKPMRS